MEVNKVVQVKVLSLGAALAAGFVPDGSLLKNPKTGAAISQSTFQSASGKVRKGIQTGNEQYPVTIDGAIFHEGLVSPEVKKVEYKDMDGAAYEIYRFADDSIGLHKPGSWSYPILIDVAVLEAVTTDEESAKTSK